MSCMCLIWLNMHLFYWILVLMISSSLRAVMTCILLNFPVSFWLDMASITCWTDVGYFLPMLIIQKLVLSLAVNVWLHGIIFYDWEMYDMLWCSQYWVTIQMGLPLGRKLILPSNISYLIKVLSESRFLILEEWKYLCQV